MKVVAENDESNSTQSNDSETKSNKKNANRFNHELEKNFIDQFEINDSDIGDIGALTNNWII